MRSMCWDNVSERGNLRMELENTIWKKAWYLFNLSWVPLWACGVQQLPEIPTTSPRCFVIKPTHKLDIPVFLKTTPKSFHTRLMKRRPPGTPPSSMLVELRPGGLGGEVKHNSGHLPRSQLLFCIEPPRGKKESRRDGD